MAELPGGADAVAPGTEAADVAVVVRSTAGERHDVIGHRRQLDPATRGTVPAEWLGPQSAQTLRDRPPSP